MRKSIDDFINLPDKLLDSKRWLLWKEIPANDPQKKPRKIPYYTNGTTRTGVLESEEDLKNLSSFDAALRALSTGKYTGLGFAFGQDGDTGNYFQGIDIDKISEHPELVPIVEDFPCYVEKSPNGNGFHALGYGKKFDALGSNESGIEAYSFGRYFTITGEAVSGHDLKDLSEVVNKKLKPIHNITASTYNGFVDYEKVSIEDIRLLRSALNCFTADDRDRWIRYGQALCRLGNVGRSLWMDWSQQSDKHDPVGDAKTWDSFKGDKTGYPAIFKDAYAFGWDGNKKSTAEPKDSNRKWISADEMAGNARAPVYMINDIIESGSHGILAGSSQAFKSFCMLKMAHSICTGKDFFDHKVFTIGKVLYICGEGLIGLGRRVKALSIVDGGFNNNLLVLEWALPIDDAAEMSWLTNQVKTLEPVLVIYDTFSSLATSTKENENESVARCLRMVSDSCAGTQSSSIIVHHFGKNIEAGSRGASAFGNNVDFDFAMSRVKGTMNCVLECIKSKDGRLFDSISIKAHIVDLGLERQDGTPTTSLVLKKGDSLDSLNEDQRKAYNGICDLISTSGIENDKKLCVSGEVLKSFLYDFFSSTSNRHVYAKRFIELLLKLGFLKASGNFFYL